jgi:hypothetical protein
MASGKLPVAPGTLKKMGFAPAEHLLRDAAASPARCDWGLQGDEGPWNIPMPHLSKVTELARVATAEAEGKFSEGKTSEGIAWLLTVHRIARHAGVGDHLISFLVQSSIDSLAIHCAARHCLSWDEATRHDYSEQWKSLPSLHTLADGYRGELSIASWLERQSGRSGLQRKEKLELLFGSEGESSPALSKADCEKFLEQFNPESMKRLVAEYRSLMDRAASAVAKPWKEGHPELERIQDDAIHSEFMLIRQAFPAMANIYDKEFANMTLRTMLDAALKEGPGIDATKAAVYRDAFEEKPLILEKSTDGSIRLTAAGQHPPGKPIELTLRK